MLATQKLAGVTGRGTEVAADLKATDLARSVAIIMDGNGRWAERRGLPVADGHREGTRALRRTVEAAIDLGVHSLAVYAFSTENWTRPADEVESLLEIFGETIERELPDLAKQGVRTRFIGRRDRVPAWLLERMAGARSGDRGERPAVALDRIRLRRPRRARRSHPAPDRDRRPRRGGRRGDTRGAAVRA